MHPNQVHLHIYYAHNFISYQFRHLTLVPMLIINCHNSLKLHFLYYINTFIYIRLLIKNVHIKKVKNIHTKQSKKGKIKTQNPKDKTIT